LPVVSALAALWCLLPNRVPSASTRGIGELDLRIGRLRSLDSGSLLIRHSMPWRSLVMESVAHLGINLTRIVPVKTTEGLAIVFSAEVENKGTTGNSSSTGWDIVKTDEDTTFLGVRITAVFVLGG
jgi:hypothetical protein